LIQRSAILSSYNATFDVLINTKLEHLPLPPWMGLGASTAAGQGTFDCGNPSSSTALLL
jgi:hypothetical protein